LDSSLTFYSVYADWFSREIWLFCRRALRYNGRWL